MSTRVDLGSVIGPKGATGTRGSRWNQGTAITGTSTTATIFIQNGHRLVWVQILLLSANSETQIL